jgi:serine/threonine protein kinase
MSGQYSLVDMGRDTAGAIYSWLLSLCCSVACTTTSFTIGSRHFKVVKQLAEGGFSYVFLVESGGEKFALKKVLTQAPEQAEQAHWEIKVHSTIKHTNCMPLIDHSVSPSNNGVEEFRLCAAPACVETAGRSRSHLFLPGLACPL